jgi:geranylgeranyl diphosphate synthase type I
MTLLAQYFERLLPVVEADLRAVLHPPADFPSLFYRMLDYHMGWTDENGAPVRSAGGKRIRPVLCLLVCEAVCGTYQPARPAAAAVELAHNFSLIHDDIQDRSPTRRGRPTLWSIWGEKQAINSGDALFVLSHLAIPRLSGNGAQGALVAEMLEILDETCLELTRGQYLDMSFETDAAVGIEGYLDMIAGKTAALLGASAHLGALAGGADQTTCSHYRSFGENLGMAFQVLDDVLDIWGDPAVTGKEAAIDIYQRKKSLPVLYALERSPELRERYAGTHPFDEASVVWVIQLLEDSGAKQYAEGLARQYTEQTLAHLEAANPDGEAGQALKELVHELLRRDR